ncbi:MAG: hypothetical protein BroJett011_62770 [Chloroflexota bacterium]|nr:MAG: hypothetical protein BroJett011_62770 [Chloroflexota bacterium]
MSKAFERQATVTASTKRSPNVSGGKRGAPATNIATLACTPLDPVQPEIAFRQGLENPFELLETFVDGGLDIREGDILVVGSTEYAIKAAAEWTWRDSEYLRLLLEENK